MDPSAIHEKLRIVRSKADFTMAHPSYLRRTARNRDGSEAPLSIRVYQHQMVVHLLAMRKFVVGDDCGLGKTVMVIAALCHVWTKDPNRKVLVLTKKSSILQWKGEFTRFTEGVTVFVADGGPNDRKATQAAWQATTGPAVLIQGYVSVGNDFERSQRWAGHILVCDEATVFKSPTTRVHKVVRHMADMADRVWALTATLIKNTLIEGYAIFKVVVPELFQMKPSVFQTNFCIVKMQKVRGGRQVPVVVGYRDEDVTRFRDMIDPYYLGRPKHAVASELPVLVTRDVDIGLTDFQRLKYEEALEGLLEMGSGDERATDDLTAITYCQEIVDHPGLIGFTDQFSEKLDALVDMVSDGGDLDGEKVIVFTRFRTMVDIAIPILEKAGVRCVRVTGSEDAKARQAAMDAFQDPTSDIKVIWITMAGGDAINLQAAKALVFYDTPWSAGDYLQILGRMIRIGSNHDRVFAIHLVCTDTVDERVQEVRRKKMKLVEAVLGSRIKGESSDLVYEVGSEIAEIAGALRSDAVSLRRGSRR